MITLYNVETSKKISGKHRIILGLVRNIVASEEKFSFYQDIRF